MSLPTRNTPAPPPASLQKYICATIDERADLYATLLGANNREIAPRDSISSPSAAVARNRSTSLGATLRAKDLRALSLALQPSLGDDSKDSEWSDVLNDSSFA